MAWALGHQSWSLARSECRKDERGPLKEDEEATREPRIFEVGCGVDMKREENVSHLRIERSLWHTDRFERKALRLDRNSGAV